MKNDNRGSITVYMCLLILALLPVLFIFFRNASYASMIAEVNCIGDMAADSLLANYDRILLKDYGLFAIDSSFGSGRGNTEKCNEIIEKYAKDNASACDAFPLIDAGDLFSFEVEYAEISDTVRLSDQEGKVFRCLVNDYMLDKYGYSFVSNLADIVKQTEDKGICDIDIEENSDKAKKDIEEFEPPADSGEDFSDVEIEDPANGVMEIRSSGILGIVCDKTILGGRVNSGSLCSERKLVNGDVPGEYADKELGITEDLLFCEYVIQKTLNYRKQKPEANDSLRYQAEYVICGKDSDEKNLSAIVNRLLLIRGGSNTIYFFSDQVKTEEARTMAAGLASLTGVAYLEPLFEIAIDTGWIYAESILDVKRLMHGKSVPLITTAKDWELGLENAINNTDEALSNGSNEEGTAEKSEPGAIDEMTYQDYLRLLLYLTPSKERTLRMMDVIEIHIRSLREGGSFNIDDCIVNFKAGIGFSAKSGYEFFYEKDGAYE